MSATCGRRARRPPGVVEVSNEQTDVYIPLTRPITPTGRILCERLPTIRAATIIVRGGYHRLAGARVALARWVGRRRVRSGSSTSSTAPRPTCACLAAT